MMDYLGQKNVGYLGSVWNILVHLESGYRTGGYQHFGPKDLIIPFNLSVERMRKLAEVIVDSTERMGNLCLDYNPVGGKVQIEVLS